MVDSKLIKIIKRLSKQTDDNKLNWAETSNENEFIVSFPDYSILLALEPSRKFPGSDDVVLTILNGEGSIIEEVRDTEFDKIDFMDIPPYDFMIGILNRVRKQVLGIDQALDSILFELKDDDELDF